MCRDSFHLLARGEKQYLKVGMVDRERRAEETLDNGHHRLCHILLQGKIGMVTICSSVTHLKCKKEKKKKRNRVKHLNRLNLTSHLYHHFLPVSRFNI